MNVFVIGNEAIIRIGFFLSVFLVMALWEVIAPRRALTQSRRVRWLNNLAIAFINTAVVRVIFPTAAVGIALLGEERGWGLFNTLGVPQAAGGVMAVLLLDLTIYAQHVFFHKIPVLWRLHRMHHTDLDIDVTTGTRFHPVEIGLSMGIKMATVAVLGAPAWSVIAFEVLLNATSMFNHSNAFLNEGVDRVLRMLVVTPDMHRVHHSVIRRETDSNFGFNLPWWDRIFGTYRPQPEKGHAAMTIGLENYRDGKWLTLPWMLAVPFTGTVR
jgi:sterol desaturase/sphingolipid hydroxylase (fatty acid hydroxylase superfamily)